MTELHTDGVIEQHRPYDGPYSDRITEQAADAIALLVRYLNNATGKQDALHYAPTVYRTIGNLSAAAHGLDQLLRQLARFSADLTNDPTLYDDRRNDTWPATRTAEELSAALQATRSHLGSVAEHLDGALRLAGHLGHYGPDEEP